LRSDDGLIRARSVEKAVKSPRRISAWITSKRGREILNKDPDAFVKKVSLSCKLKGYYLKEEYLNEYIEWLKRDIVPSDRTFGPEEQSSDNKDDKELDKEVETILSPNVIRNQLSYGLLIFYDEKEQKLFTYKRKNYCFFNDHKTRKILMDKSYLLHITDDKEKIEEKFDQIMNEISETFSITKRLQGKRRPSVTFNKDDLDKLQEILSKYK
jgi:hypothetical protein